MKKNKLLFLFLFPCILGFSQTENFDPLDELGSGYGSRNIEEIKDNEINYPSSSEEVRSTNNSSKVNKKDFDYDAFANDLKNKHRAEMQSNQDESEYAKVYSYDAEATNFDRFQYSPCYDEIGFNPTWDLTSLEKRYSECENEKNFKTTMNVMYILAFAAVIIGVFYFSNKKRT
jgi:hypothetical protein